MSGVMLGVLLATAPVTAEAAQAEPVRLECALALSDGRRVISGPAPVTISFTVRGKKLGDIHVVDRGGILFPGANLRIVQKADAVSMGGTTFPAERPGEWRGAADKKMYRLTLRSGDMPKAVEIGVARTADKTGGFGMVWNATNKPDGLPQPISGTGVGNCEIKKDSQ
jgi:hypothetical protein